MEAVSAEALTLLQPERGFLPQEQNNSKSLREQSSRQSPRDGEKLFSGNFWTRANMGMPIWQMDGLDPATSGANCTMTFQGLTNYCVLGLSELTHLKRV